MYRLYKLEIKKEEHIDILEQIYMFLEMYSGHPGYTHLADVETKDEFKSSIFDFLLWDPYRNDNNILALVIEDEDENVLEILYETEDKKLKWSENYDFKFDKDK